MKFSTRTTYGLRAMINLAHHSNQASLALSNIAREENISLKYLEKIFMELRSAGLVKSAKGASGGYKLMKSPERISVHEIVSKLEGKTSLFHCIGKGKTGKIYCTDKCDCAVELVLSKLQVSINKTLQNIKLSDLII